MLVVPHCPEWPWCTGHPGPSPESRAEDRAAAEARVRVKRALRMALRAQGVKGVTIR